MARSKVPTDPNMTPEVRRYLDDLSKEIASTLDAIGDIPSTFASEAEAEAGTSETVLMNPLRTAQAIAALEIFTNKFLHVRDEKTAGTDGGTFTLGAWRTRTLNTVKTNLISGASLASNEITLPAGEYFIRARSPGHRCGIHQSRLYDVTAAAQIIAGSSEKASNASGAHTDSVINGRFTLSVTSNIRIEHQGLSTEATDGFGAAGGFTTEVYAEVMLWKLD